MTDLATRIHSAPLGTTRLWSLGQAGFVVQSAAGHLLAIDPYLSECVERIEASHAFKRLLPRLLDPAELELDALVCTHAHVDHFDVDAVPALLANGRTRLFCSRGCAPLVAELHLGYHASRITYVAPGDSATVAGFSVDFLPCDHGTAAPDAVGVAVHVDGFTIVEAGDTCLRLDWLSRYPSPIDVLVAPINGAFGNLSERDCATLAGALSPRLTIPCHYGMFAAHHGDPGLFCDEMAALDLPFFLLRQGEGFPLTRKDSP